MVIGFLVAFLAVFGAFFFLGGRGDGSCGGNCPVIIHGNRGNGSSSSQCNGDTCSLR